MKQRLIILLALLLMAAVLVGLNAASYSQKEKTPDSELDPNRSTYNPGATGTLAFYSMLNETGRKVTRWQQPPAALIAAGKTAPAVFVVIGQVRRKFTDAETVDLLSWVALGGRLILIDREPPPGLIKTTALWKIGIDDPLKMQILSVDPSDQISMTADTPAIKPVQPTVLTQHVNAIQPSAFSSNITLERLSNAGPNETGSDDEAVAPTILEPGADTASDEPVRTAPVVHFAGAKKNILVETPYGRGRIIFLTDPYIVSNNGVSLADNVQLGVNLVSDGDGVVAFDEYHQGYGADQNRFLQFFAGTPVVAIMLQIGLLIGLVFYSRSRRFARPIPEPDPDRLSKLEYVAAMAELQGRSKAFDLAIENIYTDFRRRVTRSFGLDNFTATMSEIVARMAERTAIDRQHADQTLFRCEEIIRGEPTSRAEVVRLAAELRSFEQKLGLNRVRRTGI